MSNRVMKGRKRFFYSFIRDLLYRLFEVADKKKSHRPQVQH